jgi:hypothetical protein
VGYGAHAKYELGHDTSLNVRYNYLEPEGFTPLTLDRIGRINLATTDLSYRPVRTPASAGRPSGWISPSFPGRRSSRWARGTMASARSGGRRTFSWMA